MAADHDDQGVMVRSWGQQGFALCKDVGDNVASVVLIAQYFPVVVVQKGLARNCL
jgi:hypothetical protein